MDRKKNDRKKLDYQIAKELILELIADGGYHEGDTLPSVDKLTARLKIGRISVQKAVKTLEDEGVLLNVKGSGCYIRNLNTSEYSRIPREMKKLQADKTFHDRPATVNKVVLNFAPFPGEIEYFGDLWKKVVLEFEKENPGVEVRISSSENKGELSGMVLRGAADILQVPFSEFPIFAASGCLFKPADAGGLNMREEDFIGAAYRSSFFRGIQWGMPLAVNRNCLFSSARDGKPAGCGKSVEGFWGLMELLERGKEKIPNGAEAFMTSDYLVTDYFSMCPGRFKGEDFSPDSIFDSPELLKFLRGFEKFYRNGKIFQQDVCPGGVNAMDTFAAGRSGMSLGNTAWIPMFQRGGFDAWRITPDPVEPGGFMRMYGTLNVISASSFHPMESLDFLNFLGRFEVQRSFSAAGRCVARRDALKKLVIRNIDNASMQILMKAFENGNVILEKDLATEDVMRRLLCTEMLKWRNGLCSAEDLYASVRRKKEFFRNAIDVRRNMETSQSGASFAANVNTLSYQPGLLPHLSLNQGEIS